MDSEENDENCSLIENDGSMKNKIGSFFKRYAGIICGALSGMSSAAHQITAKLLIPFLGVPQLLLGRYIFHVPINVIIMFIKRDSFLPASEEKYYLIYKAVFDALGAIATYLSLMYIPYLESIVMYYGSLSITSVFLAKVFLSEKVTCVTGGIVMLIITGLVLTSKPAFLFNLDNVTDDYKQFLWGYFWGIVAGVSNALDGHASIYLVKTPFLTSTLYSTFSGLLLGVVISFTPIESKFNFNWTVLFYLILLGGFSVAINAFWSLGFQIGTMSEVSLASQIDIPTGAVLQLCILKIIPSINEIFGAICIVVGVCLLAVHDCVYAWLKSLPLSCAKFRMKCEEKGQTTESSASLEG